MSRTTSIRSRKILARRRGERGFALIEVIVAFVILALGLGAISTGIAFAMRSDGRSHASRVALRLAQSRLEAAGIAEALVPGHREGRMASGYRWQETITPIHIATEPPPDLRGVKSAEPGTNAGIRLFWVEIAVQGGDGTATSLSALKLASEPQK